MQRNIAGWASCSPRALSSLAAGFNPGREGEGARGIGARDESEVTRKANPSDEVDVRDEFKVGETEGQHAAVVLCQLVAAFVKYVSKASNLMDFGI